MTIKRHPDLATLMTCSAGSQPEALCAAIVSHIALCSQCQREYARMETIGVALFETLSARGLGQVAAPPRPRPAMAEMDADVATLPAIDAPAPLRPVLEGRLDDLAWRPCLPGVEHHVIALSPHARGDLRLLRLAPGARLPAHGHDGEEMTLVLRGACRDAFGDYGPGDFSDLDDEARHSVQATGDGPCILLMASEVAPAFLRD